ncbi:flagellar hook protein FlgE [Enterobacter cloacae]|nr:flagellar hook protein FlgE [Enterobacter cloacae]HCU1817297.1 flagellar hook protein FlgE [Enterobacter cloacae]
MGFSQGLSGLSAAAKALDVVGNNIANSQTVGFKSGSIAFADVFAGSMGLGVQVTGVGQNFTNGDIMYGSDALDMGINGRGFFRMESADGSVFYGRNGQFRQDENGFIYNKTNNMFLTGYQAQDGQVNPGSPVGPIRIPKDAMPPAASTAGSVSGNLKADEKEIIDPKNFDHDDPKTYNYVSQMEATDSLGNKHTIKLYYIQSAAGEWTVKGYDSTAPELNAGKPKFFELKLSFDSNGKMDPTKTTPAGGKLKIDGAQFNGAKALALNIDFADITKYAGDSEIKLAEIDGNAPGTFSSYEVSDSGEVIAIYNNGKRQTVAQVLLADFANVGGLQQQGNNLWTETVQSGQPFFGTSGTGSFGQINGGMLESSNVNLGDEMVNMIVHQRNYQSNSQTIKTQSEVLQTLVNLR